MEEKAALPVTFCFRGDGIRRAFFIQPDIQFPVGILRQKLPGSGSNHKFQAFPHAAAAVPAHH